MKKMTFLTLVAVLATMVVSCSKDDDVVSGVQTYSKDANPEWKYTPNSENYQTMLIIAKLPNELAETASAEDKMVVMAGNEIVAFAKPLSSKPSVYYLLAGVPTNGEKTLSVRYYSDYHHHIFHSAIITQFQTDGMLGTGEEPYVLALEP